MSVTTSYRAVAGYALPRGRINFTAKWDGKAGSSPQITFGDTTLMPDPGTRYALHTLPSVYANDDFSYSTANGLLSTVNADVTDKAGAVFLKLVESGIEGFKFGALGGPPEAIAGEDVSAFDRSFSVDPFKVQTAEFAGTGLTLKVTTLNGGTLPPLQPSRPCPHSICFRTLMPVNVVVEASGETFKGFSRTAVAMVPDPNSLGGYDLERAPCVQRVTRLTLTSGILTKIEDKKDSEVLACLQLPLDALKAIFAVPGALLSGRTDELKAETDYLTARAAHKAALEPEPASE